MRQAGKLTLRLVGPLRVVGSDGADRTPKGRKACALVALLALAPDNRRARKWLQDKLWSDRGEEQGSQSLRQALSELRRSLGPDRECLIAGSTIIALDRNRVQIEMLPDTGDTAGPLFDSFILLEGLDAIRDPEFENWLRDQRARFEAENERTEPPAARPVESSVRPSCGAPKRLQLILKKSLNNAQPSDLFLADYFADAVAKSLCELGGIEIIDNRSGPVNAASEPDPSALVMQTDVIQNNATSIWRVLLTEAASSRMLWSSATPQHNDTGLSIHSPDLLREINQVVGVGLSSFVSKFQHATERQIGLAVADQAIQRLLSLGKANIMLADEMFRRAFELDQRGVYLAWRAYLRTFLFAERLHPCRDTLIDETLGFVARARELDPHNSYVAAFSAHVHNVMRRSYVAAYELAQRSIELNRANPVGWACLGTAECFLGKTSEGSQHTLFARQIAGGTPFKYQVDAWSCIATTMGGDFDTAITCGEASHALAESYAAPLRYLAALYLVRGEEELSWLAVEKLRQLEPDFSLDLLRDSSYPTPGLKKSKLLKLLPNRQL